MSCWWGVNYNAIFGLSSYIADVMDLLILSIVGLGCDENCVRRSVEVAIDTVMSIFGFEVKIFWRER